MHWDYQKIYRFFIKHDASRQGKLFFWAWAALLLLIGAFAWTRFLNWNRGPFTYHDWAGITIPRLTLLMNAVREGVLPLHIADTLPLKETTDRYLAVPDMILSPQIILLKWMDVNTFVWVNFLLLYAVGFAGLVWISRKKGLSPLALTAFFLLFNFNGHIFAHISVGHYTWIAYFFYPWLIGLVLELFDGPVDWKWVLKVSVVCAFMLMQGGYHQFIWFLFLLGLLVFVRPNRFLYLAGAAVFSVLLNAYRLLPLFLNVGKFDNNYLTGYPFMQTIGNALVNVYVPNDFTNNYFLSGQIGTWEFALYIGIPAVIFLGWFGLVNALKNRSKPGSYAALLLPAAGLVLLSLDNYYITLRDVLPLPIFTGERVASRIIILAFVLVLTLAILELQRWLDTLEPSTVLVLGSLCVGLLMGNDLWQNLHLWRVPNAAQFYNITPYDASRWAVANHADAAYTQLLLVGLIVSLASLGALLILSNRSHGVTRAPSQPAMLHASRHKYSLG